MHEHMQHFPIAALVRCPDSCAFFATHMMASLLFPCISTLRCVTLVFRSIPFQSFGNLASLGIQVFMRWTNPFLFFSSLSLYVSCFGLPLLYSPNSHSVCPRFCFYLSYCSSYQCFSPHSQIPFFALLSFSSILLSSFFSYIVASLSLISNSFSI